MWAMPLWGGIRLYKYLRLAKFVQQNSQFTAKLPGLSFSA